MQPITNGDQKTCPARSFVVSISQPNRIIEVFTTKMVSRAATSLMPVIIAMSTIINDEERLYSTHRNLLRCARSSLW